MTLNGIQEVAGLISSSSTNEFKGLEGFSSKPFFVGYTKEYTNEIGWMEFGFGMGQVSPAKRRNSSICPS